MPNRYFNLPEAESWKLHMLFSPFVVPDALSKEQIDFCISTYDKMHPNGNSSELESRLVELWFALKKENPVVDEPLRESLLHSYKAKLGESIKSRRLINHIEYHMGVADSLPEWQRREYLRRHFPGFFD